MKATALFLLAVVSLTVTAQTIKIEKGMAMLDGKEWLIVQETAVDKTTSSVVVKTLSSEILAQFTFVNNVDKVFFKGAFPTVAKEYEINYPAGTGIQTVLESFHKNKVIVDGKIDLAGLQQYCNDRGIVLMQLLTQEKAKKSLTGTKTMAASGQGTPAAGNPPQVSKLVYFELKNNSSNNVRYFVGTDPKYGSGITKTTGGNTISSESGQTGEKFCIVDGNDNPISCVTISEGMNRVEINSSGTGFGN